MRGCAWARERNGGLPLGGLLREKIGARGRDRVFYQHEDVIWGDKLFYVIVGTKRG